MKKLGPLGCRFGDEAPDNFYCHNSFGFRNDQDFDDADTDDDDSGDADDDAEEGNTGPDPEEVRARFEAIRTNLAKASKVITKKGRDAKEAKEAIDSGQALATLDKWVAKTNSF